MSNTTTVPPNKLPSQETLDLFERMRDAAEIVKLACIDWKNKTEEERVQIAREIAPRFMASGGGALLKACNVNEVNK